MKKVATHLFYILVISVLLMMFKIQDEKSESLLIQNVAYSQELKKTHDKHGDLLVTIENLQIEKKRDVLKLKAVTEEQKRLQQIIKDRKNASVGIAITGKVTTRGVDTSYISLIDTVFVGDTLQLWPTYSTTIANEYRRGFITANQDSISYDFQETVPLDVSINEEGKWYQKKKEVLSISTPNPSVDIVGASSYTFQHKQRRLVFGPQIGYGITLTGTQFFIGIGLTYRII